MLLSISDMKCISFWSIFPKAICRKNKRNVSITDLKSSVPFILSDFKACLASAQLWSASLLHSVSLLLSYLCAMSHHALLMAHDEKYL